MIKINTKTINLDVSKKLYEKLVAKQGDTQSRFLLFNLSSNGAAINLTNRNVRVYAIKPDGREVFNDLVVSDPVRGACILELTNQVLAIPGVVKMELMITEGAKKLTSFEFELEIIKKLNNETSIVSTNEFTALINGLNSLSEYDKYKAMAMAWDSFQKNGGIFPKAINFGVGGSCLRGDLANAHGDGVQSLTIEVGGTKFQFTPDWHGFHPYTKGANLGSEYLYWGDIFSGVCNKGANGYTKLLNGLILQWGNCRVDFTTTQGQSVGTDITFPVAFPNKCFVVVPVCAWNNSWSNTNSIERINCSCSSPATDVARIQATNITALSNDFGFTIKWIAIGY